MANPKVTVLMSVYNGEPYLRASIDSILNQTFQDFEFIIIDDASTDSSRKIMESYKDSRIRLLINSRNLGLAASLNRGLKAAQGDFIARQDADDVSRNDRLEKQVCFMRNNAECLLVGGQAMDIDEEGREFGVIPKPLSHSAIRWFLIFDNPFVHTSVMFRKNIMLKDFNGYDHLFVCSQDYELWSRVAHDHPVANLSDILVNKRNLSDSITLTVAANRGHLLCKEIHENNFMNFFNGLTLTPVELNLISGFRFGLAPKQLNEFYLLLNSLVAYSFKAFQVCKQNKDYHATLSIQYLRIVRQALKSNSLLAVKALIKAMKHDHKTVISQLLLLRQRFIKKCAG